MARISKITAKIFELYNDEFSESYDEKISKTNPQSHTFFRCEPMIE